MRKYVEKMWELSKTLPQFKLEIHCRYFLFIFHQNTLSRNGFPERKSTNDFLSRKSIPATAISLTDLKHRSCSANTSFSSFNFSVSASSRTLSSLRFLFVNSSCSISKSSRFLLAEKWYCVSQFNYIRS